MSKGVIMELRKVLLVVWALGWCYESKVAADVVYGGPDGSMEPGGWLDLNQDGASDFYFSGGTAWTRSIPPHYYDWYTIQGFKNPYRYDEGFNGNGVLVNGAVAAALIQGAVIAPNVPGREWLDGFGERSIDGLTFDPETLFNPRPGGPRTGYLGVRLNAEDGLHYGWIQVALEPWIGPPIEVEFGGEAQSIVAPQYRPTVLDWAYESTPNTPIVAGAVPEPASAALALVGGIAVVMLRLRKRRRATA